MIPRRPTTRRICKWAALLLGVPVLLLSSYVSAWLAVSRLRHDKRISSATVLAIAPVFEPIKAYCRAELPGGHLLVDAWWALNPARPGPFGGGWLYGELAPRRLGQPIPVPETLAQEADAPAKQTSSWVRRSRSVLPAR
jgi:hypothetical protein